MKFLSRIKAIEKKLVPEDTGPPFPLWVYRWGKLFKDGNTKGKGEEMSREEVEKLRGKGRSKVFCLYIPDPAAS